MARELSPFMAHPAWRPVGTREFLVRLVYTQTRRLKVAVAVVLAAVLVLGVTGWGYVRSITGTDAELWREVTAAAIRRANEDAIVLIETQIPGVCDHGCEATGFGISEDGLIVTNRHVVIQGGVRATSIRVKFANTRGWFPATVVRVATAKNRDLALIQASGPKPFPAVVGISAEGADLPVASAVMAIGFPAGTRLLMDGSGISAIARTTVTLGAIAKVLPGVIQIDAFADHGSSGSPVFDRHGHVIGVVSGGARHATDQIVYVVPSRGISELYTSSSGDVVVRRVAP